MKLFELTIHESTGTDGHSPGTWEWRIADNEGGMSFDGGWPDEATARAKGEHMLGELKAEAADCRRKDYRDSRGRFTR